MLKNHEDEYSAALREAKANAAKQGRVHFDPIKMDALMEIEFPNNAWLVDRLIPSTGITALSGQPRSYKTWIMLAIAIAVSSGRPLFNQFETQQSNVLIVDEESGLRRLQLRLKALGATNNLPIYFWSLQNFKLEEKYILQLIKYCQSNSVEFVIFDSLVRLHGQDENDAVRMSQIFELLKTCTTYGITILFAHHNRKPANGKGGDNPSHAMRGSSDILAAVDCHIALARSDKSIILNQTKSRDAEELLPVELIVNSEDSMVTVEYRGSLEKAQTKGKRAESSIVEILLEQESISQKQIHAELIARGIKIGLKTLQKTLNEMEGSDQIEVTTGARNTNSYRLIPESMSQ